MPRPNPPSPPGTRTLHRGQHPDTANYVTPNWCELTGSQNLAQDISWYVNVIVVVKVDNILQLKRDRLDGISKVQIRLPST